MAEEGSKLAVPNRRAARGRLSPNRRGRVRTDSPVEGGGFEHSVPPENGGGSGESKNPFQQAADGAYVTGRLSRQRLANL